MARNRTCLWPPPERGRDDSSNGRWAPLGLALDYLLVFAAAFGTAGAFGVLVGILTNTAVIEAIGTAIVTLGVLCLLSAGLTGGQYAVLGVGKGAERRTVLQDLSSPVLSDNRRESGKPPALFEELSRGYRPEKDHIAFWFAIGGVLYVATGFTILFTSS